MGKRFVFVFFISLVANSMDPISAGLRNCEEILSVLSQSRDVDKVQEILVKPYAPWDRWGVGTIPQLLSDIEILDTLKTEGQVAEKLQGILQRYKLSFPQTLEALPTIKATLISHFLRLKGVRHFVHVHQSNIVLIVDKKGRSVLNKLAACLRKKTPPMDCGFFVNEPNQSGFFVKTVMQSSKGSKQNALIALPLSSVTRTREQLLGDVEVPLGMAVMDLPENQDHFLAGQVAFIPADTKLHSPFVLRFDQIYLHARFLALYLRNPKIRDPHREQAELSEHLQKFQFFFDQIEALELDRRLKEFAQSIESENSSMAILEPFALSAADKEGTTAQFVLPLNTESPAARHVAMLKLRRFYEWQKRVHKEFNHLLHHTDENVDWLSFVEGVVKSAESPQ